MGAFEMGAFQIGWDCARDARLVTCCVLRNEPRTTYNEEDAPNSFGMHPFEKHWGRA